MSGLRSILKTNLSDTRPFSLDQSPMRTAVPKRKTIAPEHFIITFGETTLPVLPVSVTIVPVERLD
jgi:hypothetical protein